MIYRWADYLKCLKSLYHVITYLVFTPLSEKHILKKNVLTGGETLMTNQATPWLFTLEKMPKADEESYTSVALPILRILYVTKSNAYVHYTSVSLDSIQCPFKTKL